MADVYGWQVLHVLLGDVELDAVLDVGHSADRDGHFSAAPQMPLLQEHVGYVLVGRVDDESLDSPDVAVGGMDVLARRTSTSPRGTLS